MTSELPIMAFESKIVDTVRKNQVTVIDAETGAGKSTQVPLMLFRAGFGNRNGVIGVTQPRRVAASNVAEYVAKLDDSELGKVIGYQIRGTRLLTRGATRVKFMTEGILLRELHGNPRLPWYSVIIVDEAHERGVNQDLILALLKPVLRRRPDLKLVIMSATINAKRFSDHFDGAPVISVPGRVFPVEVHYLHEEIWGIKTQLEAAVNKVAEIIRSGQPGDILVFMPDEATIRQTCDLISKKKLGGIRILPLFGNQAPEDQRKVFERDGGRRVIVATNIAETSITIDGVIHVVDSGLIKAVKYVSASMSALTVMEHSKAGCDQRKGRAGRTQPGICHRMYSEKEFNQRPGFTEPEIRRMALDQVLLHLRTLGYSMKAVLDLEFMDPPSDQAWNEADQRLKLLGALNEQGSVTEDGNTMEALTVAPMLGRMILNAQEYGCLDEIVTIVAGLNARPPLVRPKGKEDKADAAHPKFKNATSDALSILKVWYAWEKISKKNGKRYDWCIDNCISFKAMRQIERNRTQILAVLEKLGIEVKSIPNTTLIRKATASGLMTNLAKRNSMMGYSYSWQDRDDVFVHPASSCFSDDPPRLMVCAEIRYTTKVFALGCTEIEPAWVAELVPAEQLEYRLEIHTSMFSSGLPTLYQDIQYQNISLGRQEVTKIPAQGLPFIAANLTEKIDRHTGGWVDSHDQSWHPAVDRLRMTWSRIRAALGIIGTHNPEMRQRLVESLVEQLQGCQTLQDVIERELKIEMSDFVSGERLAEIAAEQAEADRKRKEQEREDREWREQQEAERQERIQQRKELLAPTVKLITELRDRISYLPEHSVNLLRKVRAQEQWIETSTGDPDDIISTVNYIRQLVRQAERDSGRLRMSQEIHDAILFQFPVCPLCGANWKPEDLVMSIDSFNLVCRNNEQHDLRRLLPLRGHVTPRQIGKLVTDQHELAGTVLADDRVIQISLSQARNRAWGRTKFDQVVYKPAVSVLPPELADDRDQILQDLYDLALLRAEAKDLVNKIEQTEEELGSGQVIRLTFKSDPTSGRPFAKMRGTTYNVGYDNTWPEAGETWLCRVGTSAGLQTNVTTLFKIKSLPDDLAELKEIVEESYPGLPTELLPEDLH